MITSRASKARLARASERRTYLGKVKEIDIEAMRKALKQQEPQDKPILENLITGAAWTAGQMKQSGLSSNSRCLLC